LVKRILVFFLFLSVVAVTVVRAEEEEKKTPTLSRKHQIGVRLGAWINSGDTPPPLLIDTTYNAQLETSIKDASFYMEGFFAYNILPQTYLELTFGIVNRGSVTLYDDGDTDVGNLLVYPILLHLKLYPLSMFESRLQPYVSVGGGFYYGKRDIQITTNYYNYYYNLNEDSQTDFNYVLGGGFDWLLNDKMALDLNVKYMPINFSKALITIKDYEAITVSFGVKYLYGKK